LAVLLSRAAEVNLGDTYYRCFVRLQESRTMNELSGNLHYIIDHLGPKIFSFQGIRHASALRKAERFIWENYTHKISLKEIAAASGLSAPYFSTIFKKEMGKNLSVYLNQLRVDKAMVYLVETSLPLNDIAKACGFIDQSWFSKIFKSYTGLSPGKFRDQGNNNVDDFKNAEDFKNGREK
jgi:YesN/AraC family two-component response regulator